MYPGNGPIKTTQIMWLPTGRRTAAVGQTSPLDICHDEGPCAKGIADLLLDTKLIPRPSAATSTTEGVRPEQV
jgi:hypothetical protein